MSKFPFFPLYSNDFFVDTITWELDELGLYTKLLFIEWSNGPLPNDQKKLAKIAGISPKKFANLFQICSKKFVKTDSGTLINLRLEQEREKQAKYSQSRAEAAHKRWGKQDAYASASAEHTDMQNGCSHSHSHINTILVPQTKSETPEKAVPILSGKNGVPHQQIIEVYHKYLPMLPAVREWTPARRKALAARWHENQERQSVKWWEGLFTYIADNCPHLIGRNDRNWTADLEWIVKQTNLVKILEGKYEKRK